MDAERLKAVALKLLEPHPSSDRTHLQRKVTVVVIEAMIERATKKFGGDVGVVPRQFLRNFVDLLDTVDQNEDHDPGKVELKDLTPEESSLAGGAVNQALKMGLLVLKGWSSRADNFRVRLDAPVDPRELSEALQVLAGQVFWQAPETRERLLANLPEYRLSKFQRALPRRFAMEMVFDYLLDVERTVALLGGPGGAPGPQKRDVNRSGCRSARPASVQSGRAGAGRAALRAGSSAPPRSACGPARPLRGARPVPVP